MAEILIPERGRDARRENDEIHRRAASSLSSSERSWELRRASALAKAATTRLVISLERRD